MKDFIYLLNISFILIAAGTQRLTKETYNDYINNNRVVLLKYTTTWCTYCNIINNLFTGLQSALIRENINCALAIVDGDESPELIKEHKVNYYPDVRLIVDGVVYKFTWEHNVDNLIKFIKHGIDTNPIKDIKQFTADTSSALKVL